MRMESSREDHETGDIQTALENFMASTGREELTSSEMADLYRELLLSDEADASINRLGHGHNRNSRDFTKWRPPVK